MAKKREPANGRGHSLTDAEWAVMGVVWEQEPCAAGAVQEALSESHGWAYSTVKTTMDRMVAKGLLATHAVRNLNLFSSQITRQEARRGEFRRFLIRAFDGTMSPMIQFLVEDEQLSDAQLAELRTLIRQAKSPKK